MTDIRFYHLQTKTTEQALPELLTKALSQGRRIVVRAPDKAAVEALNDHLWTFRPDSFLPHGSAKDGLGDRQIVWLTAENDNPNKADTLMLTGGVHAEDLSEYALCCDIFEASGAEGARVRWKACRDAGHDVTYWQQTENGWEKKA